MRLLAQPKATHTKAMFSWTTASTAPQPSAVHSSLKSVWPSTSSLGQTILGNLKRSPLYHSLTSLDKTKLWSRFYVEDEDNVQKVLDIVSADQKVITNPTLNTRRRTVIVKRNDDQAFGFTLQTYLLKRKDEAVPEKISYIDYVQLDSPAAEAGIRPGDVIISVNGRVVTDMSHKALIRLISTCREMRVVVIFTNVRERIGLTARAIRLRKLLNDKLFQLNLIDIEEQRILNRAYARSLVAQKIKNSLNGSLCSEATSSTSSVTSSAGAVLVSEDSNSSCASCVQVVDSSCSSGDASFCDQRFPYKQHSSFSEDGLSVSSVRIDVHSGNLSKSVQADRPTCGKTLDSVNLQHVIHIEEADGEAVLVSKF